MFANSLQPGSLVAGRYRIVRELGRGAMGAVYVVEHVNTGGQWALKVMLDTHLVAERAARFRREARASARIQSEHVVRVTDADIAPELGGAPFLVMELLSGEDLERRLADGPLSPSEVITALTQVGRGLEKAHAAGVVHRDLKPENVYLHRREDGSIIYKVLDFGISKLLRPETDPSSLSATGSSDVMGTPLYMAPEQAAAWHDRVGPGTDVWALALMAHRMLTGHTYWQGQSVPEVFVEIMANVRVAPSLRFPSLPPAFDQWFAKSCAFHVVDRYQSVSEQVAALTQALGGERASFTPSSTPAETTTKNPQLTQSPQLSTQVMARATPDPSSGRLQMAASTAAPLTHSTPPPPSGRLKGIALVALMVFLVSTVVGAVLLMREPDPASARVDAAAAAALIEPPATDAALAALVVPPPPPPPVVVVIEDAAPARPTATTVAVNAPPPPLPAVPGSAHRPTKPAGSSSTPVPGAPPPAAAGPGDLFDTQR